MAQVLQMLSDSFESLAADDAHRGIGWSYAQTAH